MSRFLVLFRLCPSVHFEMLSIIEVVQTLQSVLLLALKCNIKYAATVASLIKIKPGISTSKGQAWIVIIKTEFVEVKLIFIDILRAEKHKFGIVLKSRIQHLQRKCCCMRFQGKLYHCHFEFFSSCFFDEKLVWCSRALNNIRVFTGCVKYFPFCTQDFFRGLFLWTATHLSLFIVISEGQY